MANPNTNPNDEAEPLRDWAELPLDVLSVIFKKAGAIAVLAGAQFVCRPWRRASFDPSLWRLIDMVDGELNPIGLWDLDHTESSAEKDFVSDRLLSYLADRTSDMIRLRIIIPHTVSGRGLVETLSRFPQLEELELTFCSLTKKLFKHIGRACPHLKCFRYTRWPLRRDRCLPHCEHAFSIADYMPHLRQLRLHGCTMDKVGLTIILNICAHREYLNIRFCYHFKSDECHVATFGRFKCISLPSCLPCSDWMHCRNS